MCNRKERELQCGLLAAIGILGLLGSGVPVNAGEPELKEVIAVQKGMFREDIRKKIDNEHPRHNKKNKDRNSKREGIDKDIKTLLEDTEPIANPPELDEDSVHMPVTLFYGDGTKDTYCFFHADDIWYMKASESDIYKDADFIENYVQFNENSDCAVGEQRIPAVTPNAVPDEISAIGKKSDISEECYYFSLEMCENTKWCSSVEEACLRTRENMMNHMRIYRYAVNHGVEIPEKELETWNEKHVFSDKIRGTIEWLYTIKAYEFSHGTNVVGECVCENIDDYWNHFLLDEVYPEASEYDLSAYENKLDEAEKYYLENFAE